MVVLRPYREADRADFVGLVTDPAVMRHLGGAFAEDRAHARFDAFLAKRGGGLRCVRAAEEDGGYVGHGFLVDRDDPPGVEIGFVIAPEHQGRGLGTLVAQALLAIGLEEEDLPRLIATVDTQNAASIRVLEKTGFDDLGLQRDADGPYRLFARVRAPTSPG